MKKFTLFFVLLFVVALSHADDLPKDCYGYYAGEMMAYSVIKDDVELSIEKHDVHVQITTTGIVYKSGTIQIKGAYTFLKQSGTQYLIKAKLSNGKNFAFDADFLWNKKTKTLFLAGKNGEPDLTLFKLES
ncbi:MAG: hypothetical protein JNJ99_07670 [Crocinitomicaceae bacterium]|nr:hypothetical protein [Crocinitomicaceae bacterium]